MADIEIKIDFECDGKKYHVNPYGLMCGNSIVLYKDRQSYKVDDCFCYPSKDKLMARIDDKTYDEIGQPKKLSALFRPIAESVAEEKTTIETFSLREVYYDDDCRVIYGESVSDAQNKENTQSDTSKKSSVIFNDDTNITIFIYKHGDTIEQFGKKYVIETTGVKLDNVKFAKNPRVFSQPERIPIKPYVKEGDIRVDIPAGILNGVDISHIDFAGVILKQHECDGKNIIDEFELREVYYNTQASYLWNNDNKHDIIQFAENLAVTANASALSVKDINETHVAKSPSDSIISVCDSIKELLLEKNRKYGNSALNPCRVFSKADSVEQLKVRIDDKINRIKNEQNDEDEDVVKDLIGYLVLLIIAKENTHGNEEQNI